jgi:outer membrane protein TolC
MLFEYDRQSNDLQNDILTKSWINPIEISYNKSYTTQYTTKTFHTDNFSVSINQPIFKSGGIYYAIKYANASHSTNLDNIKIQERAMIADAVSILFNLKKVKLQQEQLKYIIKNDKIDIKQKKDSFDAGILDSSFLDQALLKKSQDETNLLQLNFAQLELKQKFATLSDKDPEKLKLPKLKLVSKKYYKAHNLQLKRDIDYKTQKNYEAKMVRSKYLPTLSLNGQYINGSNTPRYSSYTPINTKENYYNFGFSISMPINVNFMSDIELAKVQYLKAATQVIDTKNTIKKEYDWILNSIMIIDKKIELVKKDIKLYQNLYKLTNNLAKAGEKTKLDAKVMYNSLQIRKYDKKIYEIEKQLQLLHLYMRVEDVI